MSNEYLTTNYLLLVSHFIWFISNKLSMFVLLINNWHNLSKTHKTLIFNFNACKQNISCWLVTILKEGAILPFSLKNTKAYISESSFVFILYGLFTISSVKRKKKEKESTTGKQWALSRKVTCNFRPYLELGWTSVKPNLKHWILILKPFYYTEYPITLPMVGIGQMSRLSARCLPICFILQFTKMIFFKKPTTFIIIQYVTNH